MHDRYLFFAEQGQVGFFVFVFANTGGRITRPIKRLIKEKLKGIYFNAAHPGNMCVKQKGARLSDAPARLYVVFVVVPVQRIFFVGDQSRWTCLSYPTPHKKSIIPVHNKKKRVDTQ